MQKHPHVILTIFGATLDLKEFPEFSPLQDRIETRSLTELDYLPYEIVRFDINIAPLEVGNPFCESKSELKHYEAALVAVPTIASPTAPFRRAIEHGVNGVLAGTNDEWLAALDRLIVDKPFRDYLAQNAMAMAFDEYGPSALARYAVSAMREILPPATAARLPQANPEFPAIRIVPFDVVAEAGGRSPGIATVIIPLFNYGHYLEECLESVQEQTNAHELDVIVVDDCSTDTSCDIAREWLMQNGSAFNSWSLLRHKSNSGLAATRNTAVNYCQSSYYFPLDADNKLEKDCIPRCLAKMQWVDGHKSVGAVYPSCRLFGETTNLFNRTNVTIDVGKWDPGRLAKGNYIDAMALIRKSAWRRVGGYTNVTKRGGWQDYDFWCKFVECGLRAEYEKSAVALYRTHESSMLHKRTHLPDVYPELLAHMEEKHPWLSLVAASGYHSQTE